ncbi:MAG: hypothetical protein ACTSQJ_18035, partial [Promethearchaeota archaeon]
MGVKLQSLIIRKKIEYSNLSGSIIAIDAPNIIFSLLNFSFKNNSISPFNFIVDRTQKAIFHLYGLLYRINFYFSKYIFPIFCFDGRESELKRLITKDQLNDYRFTKERYNKALENNDKFLAKQIAMSKEFFWFNIIEESKILLGSMGIPILEAPSSAESQCAYLVKNKIADYSNSQDFDSLLYGCPRVIQNLTKSLRRKQRGKWIYQKIEPLTIDLKENLKRLKINQFQLVDLAILIGTDFFRGIKGIGPKTALELIRKYQNIEEIISQVKNKYDFSQLTPNILMNVRRNFLIPEVLES